MTESNSRERSPKAVICLEGSVALWNLLKGGLGGPEGASDFLLVTSPENPEDVAALCQRLVPALLVVEDTQLRVLPLKALADSLDRREVQILVLSDQLDDSSCEGFFRIGCSGVLARGTSGQILRKAACAIFDGQIWMPRKVLSKVAKEALLKDSARKITQRESEIFNLICLGFKNQQIADHLFISRETVRWHVRGLYSKIGVDSRAGAIRYAKRVSGSDGDPRPD